MWAAIGAVLKLVLEALGFVQRRQEQQAAGAVRQDGVIAQKAAQQQQVIHETELAQNARLRVDAQLRRDPDRLLEDDGYRRD